MLIDLRPRLPQVFRRLRAFHALDARATVALLTVCTTTTQAAGLLLADAYHQRPLDLTVPTDPDRLPILSVLALLNHVVGSPERVLTRMDGEPSHRDSIFVLSRSETEQSEEALHRDAAAALLPENDGILLPVLFVPDMVYDTLHAKLDALRAADPRGFDTLMATRIPAREALCQRVFALAGRNRRGERLLSPEMMIEAALMPEEEKA